VRTYTLLEAVPLLAFAAIGFIFTCAVINTYWKERAAKKRRAGTRLILQFRSSKEPPRPAAGEDDIYCEYLLWNQCDGFHIASLALFDDGKFVGFSHFMGSPTWSPDEFQAWAPLPEVGDFAYRALDREFHVNMNRAPEAHHEN
jgi:hypothetical protein